MSCLKNPRDRSQITHLARQMQNKILQEAFEDATATPYGYLLLDLRQETPEDLRLRTYIFPGEIQAVYLK